MLKYRVSKIQLFSPNVNVKIIEISPYIHTQLDKNVHKIGKNSAENGTKYLIKCLIYTEWMIIITLENVALSNCFTGS